MGIDSPPRSAPLLGTKRSAASVAQVEGQTDKDNKGKGKTSTQKGDKAVTHHVVQVVIQSPISLSRQRRRAEEDAESKESEESEVETSAEPWVGKGKVRSITSLEIFTCTHPP